MSKKGSGSEGLAEYRKKLHSLLHNNASTSSVSNLDTKSRRSVRFPTVDAGRIGKYDQRITDLENSIDLKNKKIVVLSRANLEKVETIKLLNEKIGHLQRSCSEKDKRIEQLERVIIDMQKLTCTNRHDTNVGNDLPSSLLPPADSSSESDSDSNSDFYPHLDIDPGADSSVWRLNRPVNPANGEGEIALNTQQLLNLNLNDLAFDLNADLSSSLPNRKDTLEYTTEIDSDCEHYLFDV